MLKFHQKQQKNQQEKAGSANIKEMVFLDKGKPEENDLVLLLLRHSLSNSKGFMKL